mmetsp:Transcript_20447/g.22716  ORF Transcript_20447/g.22716 Transcript_20447/m.22716 type:complete len:156 (-) Transcript_20447:86-553(-)
MEKKFQLNTNIKCQHLLHLPTELQLDIVDLDLEVYLKWALLSKTLATTTRFDGDCKKHGKWKKIKWTKHNDGSISEPRLFIQSHWVHGIKEGESKQWYINNGQLRRKCYYKNDKLDGLYISWYDDGSMWVKCTYVSNKLEGEYKRWDKYGRVWVQ